MKNASFETYAGHSGFDVLLHDTPFLPSDFTFQFLADTTVSGSIDMVVAATTTFAYQSPANTTTHITRCCFSMQDIGITGNKFGGLAVLTNGLKIRVVDQTGTVLLDFLDGQTAKSNQDLAALSGGDIGTEGAGANTALWRWTIRNAGGCLRLNPLEKFEVMVQDDLTGIDEFQWMVHGIQTT